MVKCFNPYSPGFSIYLKNMNIYEKLSDGFNPYSPGFSIYLIQDLEEMVLGADASILIHLDFLSI